MFNAGKAAQIAAFFLDQQPDKKLENVKLMQLMYLSEREAVRSLGYLLTDVMTQ